MKKSYQHAEVTEKVKEATTEKYQLRTIETLVESSAYNWLSAIEKQDFSRRPNELRDITAKLISEVCKEVECEPVLELVTGEITSSSTIRSPS